MSSPRRFGIHRNSPDISRLCKSRKRQPLKPRRVPPLPSDGIRKYGTVSVSSSVDWRRPTRSDASRQSLQDARRPANFIEHQSDRAHLEHRLSEAAALSARRRPMNGLRNSGSRRAFRSVFQTPTDSRHPRSRHAVSTVAVAIRNVVSPTGGDAIGIPTASAMTSRFEVHSRPDPCDGGWGPVHGGPSAPANRVTLGGAVRRAAVLAQLKIRRGKCQVLG